jgi:hypothetical protein
MALLLLAVAAMTFVPRAEAQVDPLWDHYKVYQIDAPVPPFEPISVTLTDQFGQFTHSVGMLQRFMTPVEKIHPPATYPINDPVLHYTWWGISAQPLSTPLVAVTNQFGDQGLTLGDAQYLLNPAVKNQPGPPPIANHYKAYVCQGAPVAVTVGMIDQFDTWQATVLQPFYYLTPVTKQLGGQVFPIVDPNQHYVCYVIQPLDPTPFTASITDQFIPNFGVQLHPGAFICVPTYQQHVTSADRDTWGRLKRLYR